MGNQSLTKEQESNHHNHERFQSVRVETVKYTNNDQDDEP
jgi:hypothetical protein